jgi:hypothetical protein
MNEVTKTHLPILAWRFHDDRCVLIYDDNPVGELTLDESGKAQARYHDAQWTFEQTEPTLYRMREGGTGRARGSVRFNAAGEPQAKRTQEGELELNGKPYRCLSDAFKIPPKVTITGSEGQPLLQFREEEEGQGKIQIDNMSAANSPQFERLVLWGLYLYLMAQRQAVAVAEPTEVSAPVRPDSEPAEDLAAPSYRETIAAYRSSNNEQPEMETPGMNQRMNFRAVLTYLVIGSALAILMSRLGNRRRPNRQTQRRDRVAA